MNQVVLTVSDWMDFSVFTEFFKSVKERVKKNYEARATYRALSMLSDRELKDIGLTRSEIHHVSYTSVWN